MEKFVLYNGKKYFIHPIYKKYAANDEGEIIHVKLGKPRKGNIINSGYFKITIRLEKNKTKTYLSHRFVFECFYGLIEKDKQINHINSIRTDNRLKNLESVTASENCIKSRINKNYSFLKDISKNPKRVKAINLFSKEETSFNSLYSVGKILGIEPARVREICEGQKYCKTANSKVNGQKYSFRYLDA